MSVLVQSRHSLTPIIYIPLLNSMLVREDLELSSLGNQQKADLVMEDFDLVRWNETVSLLMVRVISSWNVSCIQVMPSLQVCV